MTNKTHGEKQSRAEELAWPITLEVFSVLSGKPLKMDMDALNDLVASAIKQREAEVREEAMNKIDGALKELSKVNFDWSEPQRHGRKGAGQNLRSSVNAVIRAYKHLEAIRKGGE